MAELNTEELQGKWLLLPPGLQQQVLDFMEFLLDKHQLSRLSSNSELRDGSQEEAAEVVPNAKKPRVLGLNQGDVWMSNDFDEPLSDDFWLGNE